MDLEQLSCTIRVEYRSTRAELTDDCLEGILILGGLVMEILGGALETQVVIASQNENIFGLFLALGTAHVILFVLFIVVRLVHVCLSLGLIGVSCGELGTVVILTHFCLLYF